jgi:adenylate kinase
MAEKWNAILMFGAPGTGKGTQSAALGRLPGFHHIEMGEILRAMGADTEQGRQAQSFMGRGELLPDELVVSIWRQAIARQEQEGSLQRGHDVLILDGIPRTIGQARMLAEDIEPLVMLDLTATDDQQIRARIERRAAQQQRLDDLYREAIEKRFELYRQERPALLEFYPDLIWVPIDAQQSPLAVLLDITQSLQQRLTYVPA